MFTAQITEQELHSNLVGKVSELQAKEGLFLDLSSDRKDDLVFVFNGVYYAFKKTLKALGGISPNAPIIPYVITSINLGGDIEDHIFYVYPIG
jgi:hypothetical protein